MVRLPGYVNHIFRSNDRVIVRAGPHRKRKGTVLMYATKNNYIVLLDGDSSAKTFKNTELDKISQ